MSPNVALETIRQASEEFAPCDECELEADNVAYRIIHTFKELDEHLQRGGDLPRDWQEARKP